MLVVEPHLVLVSAASSLSVRPHTLKRKAAWHTQALQLVAYAEEAHLLLVAASSLLQLVAVSCS